MMFNVEYRKGGSIGSKEVSMAVNVEEALSSARSRAAEHGADNIRISDMEGREIGVFPAIGPERT
jgi:hypothetical protein